MNRRWEHGHGAGILWTLGASALLFALLFFPCAAMAEDVKVKKDISERRSLDSGGFDGFRFKLEEGDRIDWLVNRVSGDAMDVLLMNVEQYEKKVDGQGTPWFYQEYSERETDSIERSLSSEDDTWSGEFVIVVETQDGENATTTYDIEIGLERAPGPKGIMDQLCSLGGPACAGIAVVMGIVLLLIYFVAGRVRSDEAGSSSSESREGTRYVDTMMRPGFEIPAGPPSSPAEGAGEKRTEARRVKKRKKKRRRRSAEEVMEVEILEEGVECPSCGAPMGEGAPICPSCEAEIEYEESLECPLCGHGNPADAGRCRECGVEFE